MCVLKSQTLNTHIYHGRAALSTPLALGESYRRYEGREDCERNHLQPLVCQPGGNPVRQRAQAFGEGVIVAGSLALVFDIKLDVPGAHANKYLVKNVSRALVDKLTVKFAASTVQETAGYDIYKIFEDLFLSRDERDKMLSEGIQSADLNRIRSGAGDKKTSGVDEENKLNGVYGTKYRINLDHPILTDHGVFYPQALYNDLVFELVLAPHTKS